MRALRAILSRLAALVSPARRERDFDQEIESHLQLHIDDNLRAGMTAAEARRDALIRLGGLAQTRERHRERRLLPGFDAVRQDVGFTVRALRRQRGFTLTAVLTLALGIGATTAIFSLVNAVLLRPLPFAEPDRLVMVYGVARPDERRDVVSYPTFLDWRDESRSFDGVAAFANRSVTLAAGGEVEIVRGKQVTASFFDVLGVQPSLGRGFSKDPERAAPERGVILSDGFWKRRFGRSPDVVGSVIHLNDAPFTIVGVMPPGFHVDLAENEEAYASLPPDPERGHGFLRLIARLRMGVTPSRAQADVDAIAARLAAAYPRSNPPAGSNVMPLVDALAGPTRPALLVLLAGVSLVLMIACTNVASLLLARGAARRRELAVRAALGAGRARLARQLLTESLVLALAGGAAGLLLADWLGRVLVVLVSQAVEVPRLDATGTDGRVLIFTLVVSLATGVLFGVVPALAAASPDLTEGLHDAGRTITGARGPRLRRLLVVAETALALVLLAGAGVMMRTLIAMRSVEPGFDARNLLIADLWLPPTRFARPAERLAFYDAALARARALPGVESAAFVADLPLNGGSDSLGFSTVGDLTPESGQQFTSGFNIATPGYFQTLRIPIREGRGFLASDGPDAPGVIVVNEAAARRFWPGSSPMGRQIRLPSSGGAAALLTVVGVTGDVRHGGLAQPARPEIYVNALQTDLDWNSLVLAVRVTRNPATLARSVRAALREANPNVPIARVNTMEDVVARSMAQPRLYAILFGAFAAAALGLAAVGLYGLVSFTVAQRSRELSIRAALGASAGEIVGLVLRQGLGLAAVGAFLGVAVGLGATRALVGLVEGIEPNDPVTFVVVTMALVGAAGIASYVPARRASRLDPLAALRAE